MPKDIGKKRQERAKVARARVVRRREWLRAEAKKEQEKQRLMSLTKRYHDPLLRHEYESGHFMDGQRLTNEEGVMTEKREIIVEADKLEKNLQTLKDMEQEFIDMDEKRREYQEKVANGEITDPIGNEDGVGELDPEG